MTSLSVPVIVLDFKFNMVSANYKTVGNSLLQLGFEVKNPIASSRRTLNGSSARRFAIVFKGSKEEPFIEKTLSEKPHRTIRRHAREPFMIL